MWKPIKGISGFFINESGVIIDKDNVERRIHDSGNYPSIVFNKAGKSNFRYVHRLVAEAFIRKPKGPGPWVVNHKDSDKTNYHVSNLEWVTPSENSKHRSRKRLKKANIPDEPSFLFLMVVSQK